MRSAVGNASPASSSWRPKQMAKNWRRVSVEEARTNSLYGVRGWLLVLVAGMMVIGPLLGVGKINSEIMSAEHQYPALLDLHDWKSYKEAMWLSFIALTFASFYGGMGLV